MPEDYVYCTKNAFMSQNLLNTCL